MNIFDTQKALAAAFGPSGCENDAADAIEKLAAPFADEITRDVLGNLIVRKKGPGAKVMFSAHMDSIGVIITHIDKNGYLRFAPLGGLGISSILGTRFVFKNGTRGICYPDGEFKRENPRMDQMYIDIGAADRAAAQALVAVGDAAVFDQEAMLQGDTLLSPYLDDRIACVIQLLALERITQPKNDLYFVFTVQEELGIRGARTAAFGVEPDYAFAVDVTGVGDTPEYKPKMDMRMGGGAAIKIMDASVICHPQVVEFLKNAAERADIPTQTEIFLMGGTDAGAIHLSRGGVYTGAISVPTRYVHNPVEMCSVRDVEACIQLMVQAAEITV